MYTCPNYPEGKLDVNLLTLTGYSATSGYGWNVAMGDPTTSAVTPISGGASVIQNSYTLAQIKKPAATIIIGDTGAVANNGSVVNGYTMGA